jgi:DNA-binding MarR family transcriptional regulator
MSFDLIPLLHRATHAVSLKIAEIPDTDVNQAEAHILAHLHEARAARVGDIHAAFGHRRSTLTSILDRLEDRKLIKRTADLNDRRAIVVSLTPRGKAVAARVYRTLSDAEATVLRDFSKQQITAFREIAEAFATQLS